MSEGLAVLDASPIILLTRADLLPLLELLDRELLVPTAVAEELRAKDDVVSAAVTSHQAWTVVPCPESPEVISSWQLGAGESAVLAYAYQSPDTLVMLDDLEARRCAESLGLSVLGTAGLVLAAKRRGAIQSARPLLEHLIEVGMYLAPKTLHRLLRKVDE